MSNPLRLDHQVCFALYSASRATTAVYRPLLDRLGITYPQYLVMLALWETDGMTVKDLGARLELDSGTLSPLLKRLEGLGLLARIRSAVDERRVEVSLTERGRELRESALTIPECIYEATDLTDDEALTLLRLLHRATASLRDVARAS